MRKRCRGGKGSVRGTNPSCQALSYLDAVRAILFLTLFCAFLQASAQGSAFDTNAPLPQDTTRASINRPRLYRTIAIEGALWAGSMAYLQSVWYRDHARVPFEFYDDSRGYLQVDKAGHAWGSYIESYLGHRALRACGVSKGKALLYGGTLGIILQTPIEVWDGMYEGWGFSWSDMAANAAGSLLVIGQEAAWDEQPIKYKWTFTPSPYAEQANGYLGEMLAGQVFNDYNGHTYWLSVPLQKLGWSAAPPWLCISAGYSANGMFGEFENRKSYRGVAIPETRRYRQWLLSLDVDWTRIRTRSRFLKAVFNGMFAVKIPFPAVEVNGLGRVRGYGLYW